MDVYLPAPTLAQQNSTSPSDTRESTSRGPSLNGDQKLSRNDQSRHEGNASLLMARTIAPSILLDVQECFTAIDLGQVLTPNLVQNSSLAEGA
jgi:hypothetical protein